MIFGLVIVAFCLIHEPVWSQKVEVSFIRPAPPTSRPGLSSWCALDRNDRQYPAAPAECCSAAYECNVYVNIGSTKYGIQNQGPWTKRHCDCDLAFHDCLVNNLPFNDGIKAYFVAMRMTCLVNKSCASPLTCEGEYETMNFGLFRTRALAG